MNSIKWSLLLHNKISASAVTWTSPFYHLNMLLELVFFSKFYMTSGYGMNHMWLLKKMSNGTMFLRSDENGMYSSMFCK